VANVIDLLEKLGQNADLRYAPAAAIGEALSSAGVEPRLQSAILNKDQRALETLLGADTNVCCMVHAPDDDEDEDEDEEHEDDKESVTSRRQMDRVA